MKHFIEKHLKKLFIIFINQRQLKLKQWCNLFNKEINFKQIKRM